MAHHHTPQQDLAEGFWHGHGNHRHPEPDRNGRAFVIAIALNITFVVVEFAYGFIANSTALMADASHNLSDVLGLALAAGASILARKAANERYTYGLRSSSILAALINAMLLLVTCGALGWEAIQRFSHPPLVAGVTVTVVALIGVIINSFSAWLFFKGSQSDLNIRGAYLHMAVDAAVSVGVVMAGVAIVFIDWNWLDPAVSLVIVTIVIIATWEFLRDSVRLALDAVPPHIEVAAIDAYLREQPGVADIHDLHIWGLSTTESALTVHLVMPDGYPGDAFMEDIRETLHLRFLIHHSTIQIEQGTVSHLCSLE
ncbi:cation diffusion facilitator family transporter [Nitrosomonas sp. Nm132]|uniref:cation diffusion facilitator family transporter n=1 Tax=Nitrosomonas sp. Nm132 TaxID=1881053 RepID=UPI000890BB2E|nr:cation diffusion facilitator family transporter [Nitrosomonas sp. Nm132]SDH03900.1 cobalt-zinc-cadmium efflux system protein [Nitrosomonas sp. Nm132]